MDTISVKKSDALSRKQSPPSLFANFANKQAMEIDKEMLYLNIFGKLIILILISICPSPYIPAATTGVRSDHPSRWLHVRLIHDPEFSSSMYL